jgi:hypothetical protein
VVDVRSGPFRRRVRGRPACCSTSFFRREIKRDPQSAHSWSSERDKPAGTSEHIDQASDLLRRESDCCCRNRSGLLRRESEWCRKEKTKMSNNKMRLRCEKKASLGGNQRRRVLIHETHPIGSLAKETHPTSMRLQYEIISNGLYSPLPIRQRSVTNLSSSLLLGD